MTRLTFHSKTRAEYLIATGRVILSAFFLFAVWLDPSEPTRYAQFTYAILWGYVVYSLVVGAVAWRKGFGWAPLHLATHSIDLLVFACLMFLTTGPNSPFFVYFIFILVCATFRWQWRGTLWTAVAAMSITVLLACYPSNLLLEQSFELNRFIIRIAYLAVVAGLLGYLGAYEESMLEILAMLSQWPRETLPEEPGTDSQGMLGHAAAILKVPRVVLLWEEEDEPWLHQLCWTAEGCRYEWKEPGVFGEIVTEGLEQASFFTREAGSSRGLVVCNTLAGLQQRHCAPLHPEFVRAFNVTSACVSPLNGERISGYLVALDRRHFTPDDLVLGGIVAHEIAARLDHALLLKQLQQGAAADERLRLAHDLHDGLLQSLAGAGLQLAAVSRLIESDPAGARESILQVQQLLAAEQRDLRTQINDMKPLFSRRKTEEFGLVKRLDELAGRIKRQWEVACSVTCHTPAPRLQRNMAREIYFVVHEALINAVRHAGATTLRAEIRFDAQWARITVIDDGRGFGFQGCYDQDQLSDLKRGPVTLRERIDALNGKLVIDSSERGARLDITLPVMELGG
ncbi:GAF domain-containing sensor histidine kinase [Geomonas anaerohicana]|uniref:GAF domain-containing sensor histidine kinase n=1 Tax=Geomonas anaerohicana TaxID=2798583 RepID=A0ABS0Y9V4_9BACT|nr:GAF domain-containing sensor histidine kinase [Geomonas anaerohicana]MBJ6749082.1 GAF domain-containing sensor histidine kinase [Geomonas anaerohicana]